jgi:hypothetical protein
MQASDTPFLLVAKIAFISRKRQDYDNNNNNKLTCLKEIPYK